jgi:multiple sugar transport system substrate-binding protein
MGKRGVLLILLLTVGLLLVGCGSQKSVLDPENPVTITLWNYYNGQTKAQFDDLVNTFNETVGMQEGIVVDAYSQGDVQQLATAVYDAANGKIGAQKLPNIFAAYPENAFRVNEIVALVNIEDYFSEEELNQYRTEFLNEGRFGPNHSLYILPIAKSSENLFLNRTFWNDFASETGYELKDLETWEGILEVAEAYYHWTDAKTVAAGDGNAFMGIDSASNFMYVASVQLGNPIYTIEEGQVTLNLKEETSRHLWDTFYMPYYKGYFVKTGRFSSDDAKVGRTLAYIGSTAGAGYFPNEITMSESEVIHVESAVLPYPVYQEGKPYVMQQGAGMCMTQSDEAHELASSIFLKWLTQAEQNILFAKATGYFPVMNEALKASLSDGVAHDTIKESIETTLSMLDQYTFYSSEPFLESYDLRQLLEITLFEKALKDRQEALERDIDPAADNDEVMHQERFETWFKQFEIKVAEILTNK